MIMTSLSLILTEKKMNWYKEIVFQLFTLSLLLYIHDLILDHTFIFFLKTSKVTIPDAFMHIVVNFVNLVCSTEDSRA